MAGTEDFLSHLDARLEEVRNAGLYKSEAVIASPQSARVRLEDGRELINFCANNYLGLANDPRVREAGQRGIEDHGFGMASVRFICGTQSPHKDLERRIAGFLGVEDAILYSSCFDANGGLFESLLDERDAIVSDALNHASIIDGIRLCKAKRFRYANNDMSDLRRQLEAAADSRFILIATDGVFSMDGIIANLKGVCDLAEEFGAMVMVDDSHAVGFLGASGKGSIEYCGVEGRVDIVTGTLGKALGGASGGYTAGRQQIVDWLRQTSRPYLFSNTLMPAIVNAAIRALALLAGGDELRSRLFRNAELFRSKMTTAGFKLAGKDHPIIPVMVGDAKLASELAQLVRNEGVLVTSFSYPVVPHGQARIRTQMSAAHTSNDIDFAVDTFVRNGRVLGII